MALDAVVFPQDPFGYICSSFRDYFQAVDDEISDESISRIMDTHSWRYEQLGFHEDEGDKSLLTILDNKNNTTFANRQQSSHISTCANDHHRVLSINNSSPEEFHEVFKMPIEEQHEKAVTTRSKRRRTKASKNKEEEENQRMTHIAVERNRRKLMNEYLAALRSLMPSSYALRGDQASIIGGAINFVKQLEQLLQTLEAKKSFKNSHQQEQQEIKAQQEHSQTNNETFLSPFSNFFTFPQYTTTKADAKYAYTLDDKAAAAADIEVTIVESHANVKILTKRCPKQLVKLVSTFQNFKLNVQHLNNVSSMDHMVLYSVSVKVEEGCKLNTVDEIAAAVNKMLHKIDEESRC